MEELDEKRAFPAVEAQFKCDLDTQEGREYALNALRATSIIIAIHEVDNRLRNAHKYLTGFHGCENDKERDEYNNSAWYVRQMIKEVFDEFDVSYVWEV